MENKFTPGPWEVGKNNLTGNYNGKIFGKDGAVICAIDFYYKDTVQPNAHLIAASPLMFTALTELIEIRQQMMISGETKELRLKEAEAYNKAYVAIEKAVPKVSYEIPAYPSDY